jgi:hypothetical protein
VRRVVLVLALAVIAIAAPVANAKPKTVKPSLALVTATGTSATVSVTFKSATCKGKVTLKALTAKKKYVTKYVTKKASLAAVNGACVATTTLKLPAALYGTKVAFTAEFAGSSKIKKFSKTKKLTVLTPTPPSSPAPPTPPAPAVHLKGVWRATITGQAFPYWDFTIGEDNSVPQIQQFGTVDISCGAIYMPTQVNLNIFTSPFTVVGDAGSTHHHFVNGVQTIDTDFQFSFGATTGTGTFTSGGQIYAKQNPAAMNELVAGCSSGTIPLVLTFIPPG